MTSIAGFELLVCPMHRFEGDDEVPQGVHSGIAHEQGITQGDGLERCTASIVKGVGRLGQRLILQLHDHS